MSESSVDSAGVAAGGAPAAAAAASVALPRISTFTSTDRKVPSGAMPFSCAVWSPGSIESGIGYDDAILPFASVEPRPSSVGVENIQVEVSLPGRKPSAPTSNSSPAAKTGIPLSFNVLVFALAPIATTKPSLVRTSKRPDVRPVFTHPSRGMPKTTLAPSATFSRPVLSLGTLGSGSVVVVVDEVVVVARVVVAATTTWLGDAMVVDDVVVLVVEVLEVVLVDVVVDVVDVAADEATVVVVVVVEVVVVLVVDVDELEGGAATVITFEFALTDASGLLLVSTTRCLRPSVTSCVDAVAPATLVQVVPSGDVCHCHVGVSARFHVPLVALRVAPIAAVPAMVGGTELVGATSPGT